MTRSEIAAKAVTAHQARFKREPEQIAYAPGRIEVLGNHTDYNDGFVLSAAINMGTVCAISGSGNDICTLFAPDIEAETHFKTTECGKRPEPWVNYITGVAALLLPQGAPTGFDITVSTNIPIGSGLSSSAALEVACATALCALFKIPMKPMDTAKLCQRAENEYTGAKCGLLDQISSVFGREHSLIFTDFRTLEISHIKIPDNICFLMADTKTKHALVDSQYNERRAQCEEAAEHFAKQLPQPVSALRDVSVEDWQGNRQGLADTTARRALHVIGENRRVIDARKFIISGHCEKFGELMFDSHESSRVNFENSCPELDFIVNAAREIHQVMGARLSGGGFGGSAVIMVERNNAKLVIEQLAGKYTAKYGTACDIKEIIPSGGARLV